jgi:hypothetical protein
LAGRGGLGQRGGLRLRIGAAPDAVIVEAMPVLLRRRAARTRARGDAQRRLIAGSGVISAPAARRAPAR